MRKVCFPCLRHELHPWHDDGTPTAYAWLWSRGQVYGSPEYYNRENNYGT